MEPGRVEKYRTGPGGATKGRSVPGRAVLDSEGPGRIGQGQREVRTWHGQQNQTGRERQCKAVQGQAR